MCNAMKTLSIIMGAALVALLLPTDSEAGNCAAGRYKWRDGQCYVNGTHPCGNGSSSRFPDVCFNGQEAKWDASLKMFRVPGRNQGLDINAKTVTVAGQRAKLQQEQGTSGFAPPAAKGGGTAAPCRSGQTFNYRGECADGMR